MTRTRAAVVAAAVIVAALAVGGVVVALDGDDGNAGFCAQLNDIYRTSSRADQIDLEDTVAVEEELRAMQSQFDELRGAAPGVIADDVEAIAAWADRVARAALDNPPGQAFDRAAALGAASGGAASLNGPLQRLDAYRAESC